MAVVLKNRALFLDRDGVVNIEKHYLYKVEDFEFIDGVIKTCQYFIQQGYLIIIITNQAGIAREKYSENDFQLLSRWMLNTFKQQQVTISAIYHCPHHPTVTGDCDCRKPKPGMIQQAQSEFSIDLEQSLLVGDKNSDIGAGINAGIKNNYLISTGHEISSNPHQVPILNNLQQLIDISNTALV